MPKRIFNGDKAWKSDKLKQLPEPLAAEYAWMYSLALADGTFEANPERIYSDAYSYARNGWNAKKIAKILDKFEEIGLLQRKKDEEGKVWGYWTGSESEMPSETETRKYKKGKKYIFDTARLNPEPIQSESTPLLDSSKRVWFGLDRNRLGKVGEEPPRRKGEYRKDEFSYLNRKPDKIYLAIVDLWSEIVGPGAICRKPFKRGWDWFTDTCAAVDTDTLIPAFELWALDNPNPRNESPIGDFLREIGNYTKQLATPKQKEVNVIEQAAIETSIERDIEESKTRNARPAEIPTESIEDLFARVEN